MVVDVAMEHLSRLEGTSDGLVAARILHFLGIRLHALTILPLVEDLHASLHVELHLVPVLAGLVQLSLQLGDSALEEGVLSHVPPADVGLEVLYDCFDRVLLHLLRQRGRPLRLLLRLFRRNP